MVAAQRRDQLRADLPLAAGRRAAARAAWRRRRPCCATARGGELPRREVVPGDVVRLSAGDLVPADARLLEARDLHVQQAALTGESLPVEKEAATRRRRRRAARRAGARLPRHLGRQRHGDGASWSRPARARRSATSPRAWPRARRRPSSSAALRRFGLLIMQTVVLPRALHPRREPRAAAATAFESLLFAVALAVGLTPEFLPMITTVTLAQGAVRMARAAR